MVWSPGSPTSDGFIVEGLTPPSGSSGFEPAWLSAPILGNGIFAESDHVQFRVVNIGADGDQYAASAWVTSAQAPTAKVTLVVEPENLAMANAATVFATDLQAAGYWTNIIIEPTDTADDFVVFAYTTDSEIAKNVMSYLPQAQGSLSTKQKAGSLGPGEIRVNLSALQNE